MGLNNNTLFFADADNVGTEDFIRMEIDQQAGFSISARPDQSCIPQTTRFKDIGLLRMRDIPEIEPIIVEDRSVLGPLGAKGMGELALAPTPPAIVNAINNAVAIELNAIPITPEKVLTAIQSLA